MKRSSTLVLAILTVGSLAVGSSDAWGGGGNKGGGFNFGGGGFTVGVGNLNRPNGNHGNNNGRHCDNGGYNNGGCSNGGQFFGQALEPFHSSYFVQPGDTFYEVSLKEYGTSGAATHIARFNRLASNVALIPGQRLLLPSVSANGRLTQSRAPAPFVTSTPNFPTDTTAKFTAAATTAPATESSEPLPKLSTGSLISLDGQEHGSEQGVVRLRIGGVALPVEVVEWTASSAKVRLPQLELTEDTKAVLEVLKADGALASSNGIELTSADSNLAKN